ncbi:MAG: ArsR/SmtB family transcription factor [Bacteroidia bacterium]
MRQTRLARTTEFWEEVAEKLRMLGHPIRLRILSALRDKELNVTQLQKELDLPQATLSHHLNLLRRAGILQCKRQGQQVCYFLPNTLASSVLNCVLSHEHAA